MSVSEQQEIRHCIRCGEIQQARQIDQHRRWVCPDCGEIAWDNPVPVVAAIVEHQNSVLLARNARWPPKAFGLITGFLEAAETPEAAVLREVEEELGLSGRVAGFVGHFAFIEQNQLLIVYHVCAEGEIRLNEEIAEVRWIPERRLKPWSFGTGPALKVWLERRRQGSDPTP